MAGVDISGDVVASANESFVLVGTDRSEDVVASAKESSVKVKDA